MALRQMANGALCGFQLASPRLSLQSTNTLSLTFESPSVPFCVTDSLYGAELRRQRGAQRATLASWRTAKPTGRRAMPTTTRRLSLLENPQKPRRSLTCAARAEGGTTPEEALKTTVELDRFIDTLLSTDSQELPLKIAENVLAFDRSFWLRLATRADSCQSEADQLDMQDLAGKIMATVETIVKRTQEKIDDSTSVLEDILKRAVDEDGEIRWPPSNSRTMSDLKQAIDQKQMEGFLDEGFLASVSAQLRQATEKGDRPGLVALLQKVLQLYASTWLAQRSFATQSDGTLNEEEKLLEDIISAEEEDWEPLLRQRLKYGGGPVGAEELLAVVEKRMERMLMRTEGGSYQQRIVGEYLNEIDTRTRAIVEAFKASPVQP